MHDVCLGVVTVYSKAKRYTRGVQLVEVVTEDVYDHVPGLGYVQITDVYSTNITFEPVNCSRRTVVYMVCSELACGVRPLYLIPHNPTVEGGVVRTAGSGDWPWSAALLKDGVHACDATLIHPSWLLTTSLCFQGQGRALWVARLGGVRISSEAPWVQERLIVGMVKSPVEGSQIVLIKVSITSDTSLPLLPPLLTPPPPLLPPLLTPPPPLLPPLLTPPPPLLPTLPTPLPILPTLLTPPHPPATTPNTSLPLLTPLLTPPHPS
ncbi:hypothetical protein Pcinc_040863 [Petrolisthes cinctipes]|uniref:Peptidase S1 domain-containing protein n=1 Tax=Petrolisthes cinctipes TaxID=88211 RepID=A0AAE1BLD4_PETCI|nr:hypothetical protein Pcinc_040863 [Petrolisthes cinctipes]